MSSKRSRFKGESITQCASDLSAAATLVAAASISNVQSCETEIDIVRPNDSQAGSMRSPALTIPGFITLPPIPPQQCSTPIFVYSSLDEKTFQLLLAYVMSLRMITILIKLMTLVSLSLKPIEII